jgi:hypothetical protein
MFRSPLDDGGARGVAYFIPTEAGSYGPTWTPAPSGSSTTTMVNR